jgi:hypothetical protein
MRTHLCLLVMAIAAISAGFTDQQLESARIWAHETNEAFETCLQKEVRDKLHLKMAREDFSVFIKGVCTQETRAFRVLLVDYLAMKNPAIDAATPSCDRRVCNSAMAQCSDPTLCRTVHR